MFKIYQMITLIIGLFFFFHGLYIGQNVPMYSGLIIVGLRFLIMELDKKEKLK